jgi:hypothetical protein
VLHDKSHVTSKDLGLDPIKPSDSKREAYQNPSVLDLKREAYNKVFKIILQVCSLPSSGVHRVILTSSACEARHLSTSDNKYKRIDVIDE